MPSLLALLALTLTPQDPDALPVLSPNKVVGGEIIDADREVRTARLDGTNSISAARGDTYRLAVEEDGVYTVELRSDLFDAYLVLRNTKGDLLEEDNDGLLVTHARIVFELVKDRPYFVQACALRGETGAYELTLSRGEPEQLTDEHEDELETAEARRIVSVREDALGPEHPVTLEGLYNLARRLVDQRELEEGGRLARRVLEIRERELGSEHSDTAASLNLLAYALYLQEEYEDAETLARRALDIREEVLGGEHLSTALSLHLLASTYYSQDRFEEAEPLLRRALKVRESIIGAEHRGIVSTVHQLGWVVRMQGRVEEAEPLYWRALETQLRTLDSSGDGILDQIFLGLDEILRSQSRYEELEATYRRAVEAQLQVLDPSIPDTLLPLTWLFEEQLRNEEAEALYRHVLEVHEKALGEEIRTARMAEELGAFLHYHKRYDEAVPLFRQVVNIREKAWGSEDPVTIRGIQWLAYCLHESYQYEEAERELRRLVDLAEKVWGPEHPDFARTLKDLGTWLLVDRGAYKEAEGLLRRALEIQRRSPAPEELDTHWTLAHLANALELSGEWEEAESTLREALRIAETVLGPEDQDTANVLDQLGQHFGYRGQYEEAEPFYRRALSIRERILQSEDLAIASSFDAMATLFEAQSRYEEAETLRRRSLEIQRKAEGEESIGTARRLSSLAWLLKTRGKYTEAEGLLHRAIGIIEKQSGRDTLIDKYQTSLGSVLVALGRHEEAERLYREALETAEARFGSESLALAPILHALARVVRLRGNASEAERLYHRALEIDENWHNQLDQLPTLRNLARLLLDQQRTEEAWELFQRAFRGTSDVLRGLVGSATEMERFVYVGQESEYLEYLVSVATDSQDATRAMRNAAYEALLNSKGQVFRSTAWLRNKLFDELSQEQSQLVRELQGVQSQLSRFVVKNRPSQSRRFLETVLERRHQLESELVRSVGSGWNEEQMDVAELTRSTPEESVLLDFHVRRPYRSGTQAQRGDWGPDRLSAWILHPSAEHVEHVDLGPASDIKAAVQEYLADTVRDSLSRALDDRTPPIRTGEPTSAERLRKLLWDPLREEVSDAELVIVSPDMFLATLPFEILREEDGSFLIEKHRFVYTQDARSLTESRDRNTTPSEPSLLAIGAVDYNVRAEIPSEALAPRAELRAPVEGVWGLLGETGAEVDGIEGLHRQVNGRADRRVLIKDQATEEALKLSMPHFRFLHLATHGFFDPARWQSYLEALRKEPEEPEVTGSMPVPLFPTELPGLLSGLALAGANLPREEDREDGLLTAEEVAWLDLRACELVVLSACQTGVGLAEGGEGLMSLRRSFHQAGAKTVISSLWKVEDKSTRELMLDFYGRYWQEGQGVLEALRSAQLDMLRRNREEKGEALPATWGAFVLSGNWR